MRSPGVITDRRGVSLVELLLALTLFAIAGGAILRTLDRQVRLHSSLMAILEARGQHAATHEMVAATLRGLDPSLGDILAVSDSALVARIGIGAGVACAVSPGSIALAPDTIAGGQRMAHFSTSPQAGDSLWIMDEGPTDATIDDAWRVLPVTSVARAASACPGSPLLNPVDAARPAWRLDVPAPVPSSVLTGAPVRLTRPARLALYRSGSDSWLGFADWNGVRRAWNVIQPISGPFLPYDRLRPQGSGVALATRDSTGSPSWSPAAGLTAIQLITRTVTRTAVRADGMPRGRKPDSLRSLINLRNSR